MNAAKRCSTLGLLSLALAAGIAQSAESPVAGLAWLRELAGHCWSGEQADGKPADTQCYELQFGRHLRGTIEIPGAAGEGPKLRGDSGLGLGSRETEAHGGDVVELRADRRHRGDHGR